MKSLKVSLVVGAVAATFAGQAGATIYGAGASAVANSMKKIIFNDYCTAGTISYYDNDTSKKVGGSVFLVNCTKSSTTGASALTANPSISIDTSGGSWKGLTAVDSSLFSAQLTAANNNYPLATINTGACAAAVSTAVTIIGTAYTLSYFGSCGTSALTSTQQPTIGFTDVESQLFADANNQPLQNGTWDNSPTTPLMNSGLFGSSNISERTNYPVSTFGLVFGLAASAQLYSALQYDQIQGGTIPSACAGLVETSQTNIGCAPAITRTQYRNLAGSLATAANGGNASYTSGTQLFLHSTPTDQNIVIARRDQGSGSQASSNAFFFGIGCSSPATEIYALTPGLPSLNGAPSWYMYNFTTGGVVNTVLGGASSAGTVTLTSPTDSQTTVTGSITGTELNVIGVISADNESKLTGGAGFLRLDGVYPSNVAAANGNYNYVVPEQLHCNASASGDASKFCDDLAGLGSTSVSAKSYTGTAVVPLASATAAVATFPLPYGNATQANNPTVSFYAPVDTNSHGDFCTGMRAN